jgi:lipopolysaccharide transport system permease protein
MFFSTSIMSASQSLITHQNLLTKVYFPRLFIPTATVGAYLVDFGITLGIYSLLLFGYGFVPSWQVVFLPVMVALTLMTTLGLSYILSGLTLFYRDFRYVVPFMVQLLMFMSPVIYPLDMIPPQFRWVASLNPMAGIIQGYRSSILGAPWDFISLSVSTITAVILFVFGAFYFRKVERRFADLA